MNRDAALDRLRGASEPFDLIVIGGGATGLGTAVDAASRGHRVLLLEQSDFARGTSSRSTKLVHGGMRYLRQGNLSLVIGALRERGLLFQNAPHLVRDLSFIIPGNSLWEKSFYGAGLKTYDLLAGKRSLGRSRLLSAAGVRQALPTLQSDTLRGGVLYHDGQFDDARLAVHLAMTAAEHGACMLNYVRCEGFLKENGRIRGVLARDMEGGEEFEIRGRIVVNATGVFVDELRQKDAPGSPGMVTVSQGVHLVLTKRFLPGDTALMIPKTSDGRVLFAIPWHGRVVLGTTDTPRPSAELEPRALPEETAFLMEHAAKILASPPKPEDVLCVYAGLRPLVKAGDNRSTSSLSRDHVLRVSESGLLTVTGGKWTTYRKMAEDVVSRAETHAGLAPRPCVTRTLPLHGWTREHDAENLLSVYGADADKIRSLGASPLLHPDLPATEAEVRWHAREEMARTVEDVLARRTRSLFLDAKASIEAAPAAARILAEEHGRDEAWIQSQMDSYQTLAEGYCFAS